MSDSAAAPREDVKHWKMFFTEELLRRGEAILAEGQLKEFSCTEQGAKAVFAKGTTVNYACVKDAPTGYSQEWRAACFQCSCAHKRKVYAWELDPRQGYIYVCAHEAAAMLRWEQEHGPWRFTETEAEIAARLAEEREAERLQRERERQKALREREEGVPVSAADFFDPPPAGRSAYFDVKRAVRRLRTNQYCVRRARELLDNGTVELSEGVLEYGAGGEQQLRVEGQVRDELDSRRPRVTLTFAELIEYRCGCQGYGYNRIPDASLCEHELALLARLREWIEKENPGDATDMAAERFFREMEAAPAPQEEAASAVRREKERCLVLSPRIAVDQGEASLSFKLGRAGGKTVILKGLKGFVDAVERETEFALSRTAAVDFSKEDFTEDSRHWLTFIQRRVSETEGVNERLQARSTYTRALPVRMQDSLSGATLDRFYELAEGGAYELQDRTSKAAGTIRVGHAPLRVRLTSERIGDAAGHFLGLAVTGTMPVILKGSAGSYILGDGSLSRITREEEKALGPFRAASDVAGNIRFRVGKEKLAEFYYRAVPALLESPYVDFEDGCAGEAEPLLPPEPVFTFLLDLEDDLCLCRVLAAYDGPPRPLRETGGGYRDAAQEERVERAVRKYFPNENAGESRFWDYANDESLYRLLTEGVSELSRLGEVRGSDAFGRVTVRPAPQLRVGVSVESGLLDIELLTKDMEPEELLGVLESYRRKKKFHRLRSGEFIPLAEDGQLGALEELLSGVDASAEDLVRGGVRLPMYRALYLDSMLEAHDALAASRDRTYRALLKNFRAIRDADYEVPAAQAETLRPYQVYGYKWLRTLAAAGFGGILADEMGLGKTVQAIALLQALREEGNFAPALVVCPASLVYNWQEEFRRFAPGLDARPVAGSASARKKLLEAMAAPGTRDKPDVLITSYDLLRSDAARYEGLLFSAMVLDEAQYIKNQKAAMTKAVKIIRAQHRFALTGTPIENRLAELWSIFDFLMPGFLYGYADFAARFETPIVKNKDEACTEKLKRMVSPFILRRLKADVLKDLPPKLEEIRYTRFEAEQRKLYDGQVVRMRQMLSGLGGSGEDKLKILAELTRIRQICCDPALLLEGYTGGSAKRAACLELVQSAISGGHRCLIFSQFTSMLALLEEDFQRERIGYYLITGATPKEQRVRLVRDFNAGDTPVFLISLKAGGTGLNLTGADVVIHYDPWWNLAAQNQATDRAHRIGQKNQVTVYRMIVKDTIEEKILALQEAKRDLSDAILSGESTSLGALSSEELLALLG